MFRLLAWLLVVWLLVSSVGAEEGLTFRTLSTPAGQRRGWVYVPPNGKSPAPLLVVLHGAGSSAGQVQRITEFSQWADEHGWIVCFPEALAGHWNDGRSEHFPELAGQDDVAFVRQWMDLAVSELGADANRRFVCGFDSGGALALLCGLQLSSQVKGVAACMASLASAQQSLLTSVSHPSPMLVIHSEADPCWPFQGGPVRYFGGVERGRILSSQDLILGWSRAFAGKALDAAAEVRPAGEDRLEWWCRSGNTGLVGRYVLKAGGHIWPGTPLPISEDLFGAKVKNGSATQWIGTFFRELP